MKTLGDLSPTEPLRGLHMKGTVTRRFLVTYPIPPEVLAPAVPPCGELVLHNGLAWVSACFVHIARMRPSFMPDLLGIGFNYLIHRTLARLPYPDGKMRNTVLVLEANINRQLLALIARKMTGVRFRVREITLTDLNDAWVIRMKERQKVLYEAEIYKDSIDTEFDGRSQFMSAGAADRFLLGISFGAQWEPGAGRIKLLAETHDPWHTYVGQCKTNRHALLKSLGVQQPSADHVITMTDIPHYFALRGIVVACPAPSSVPTDKPTGAGGL
jgi:uncharacterized protein YqjF (DUF2071 family)